MAIYVGVATAQRQSGHAGVSGWWYEPARFPRVALTFTGVGTAVLTLLGFLALLGRQAFAGAWVVSTARQVPPKSLVFEHEASQHLKGGVHAPHFRCLHGHCLASGV